MLVYGSITNKHYPRYLTTRLLKLKGELIETDLAMPSRKKPKLSARTKGQKNYKQKTKQRQQQFMDESLSQPQENDTAQPEGK